MNKTLLAAVAALCLSPLGSAMAQPTTYVSQDPVTGTRGSTPGIQADTTGFLNMTTATTTKIVTGVAGLRTYFTEVRFHSTATTTAKLVTGTGANCATGTADLTETLELIAADGEVMGVGVGPVVIAAAGLDVCVVNSAAQHLQVGWAEAQF
jgi:hypothetical protein